MLIGLLVLVYTNTELTEPEEVMEKNRRWVFQEIQAPRSLCDWGEVCPSEVW